MNSPPDLLKNLQLLRAFAAVSVATFHFSLIPVSQLPVHPGAFGVDLFFVLSGFIIAYSAERNSKNFLAHRLIRVLPPYWIATLIGFGLVVWHSDLKYSLEWLGQSLLFLPGPGGRGAIIFVAWTLVYELAFYLLYALCLRISAHAAPIICALLLVFLAFGVNHVGLPLRPWPLLVEFAYGLALFVLWRQWKSNAPWLSGLAALLVAAGVLGLYLLDGKAAEGVTEHLNVRRVLVWGIPSAAIVWGLLLWERRGIYSTHRALLSLGNASYAIYLLHPLLLGLMLPYPQGSPGVRSLWFCGATALTIAIAVVYFRVIEAPVIGALRRRVPKN